MNALAQSTKQNKNAQTTKTSSLLVQRKCACGGVSKLGGQCSECESKKLVGGNGPLIQPKLKIGQPNDKYEQEADRVAEQVMRMPEPKEKNTSQGKTNTDRTKSGLLAGNSEISIQRQEEPEQEDERGVQIKLRANNPPQRQQETNFDEKEDFLQAKATTGYTPQVTPNVAANIQNLRGAGQPLQPNQRHYFESRMGQDFSGVRIHTDSKAADTAQTIQAKAFTLGNNIVFNTGQYSHDNQKGKKLLAHELTHVVQQNGGASGGPKRASTTFTLKREAETAARRAKEGTEPSIASASISAGVSSVARAPMLQRDDGLGEKEEEMLPERVPFGKKVPPEEGEAEKGPIPMLTLASTARPTCDPTGLARKDFLAQPHTSTKDLGLTRFGGTFRVAFTTRKVKGRVMLEPLKVALPAITSVFTKADKFYEEGTSKVFGCPGSSSVRLLWKILRSGAAKIREGEMEHCQDLQYAYDVTLGWYAQVVAGLIAKRRTFRSESAALKRLEKLTGTHPTNWLSVFICLTEKTKERDKKKWHKPKKKRQQHTKDCVFSRSLIDAAHFPEMGKHPTPDVIEGCGESPDAVKSLASKAAAAKASAGGEGQQEGKPGEPTRKTLAPISPTQPVLQMQRAIGNQGALRQVESGQLRVSQPGDRFEREADSVADQVLRMPDSQVQRRNKGGRSGSAQSPIQDTSAISTIGGSGQPLSESTRSYFEPRFGHVFNNVRVHTDWRAVEAARLIGARAYTIGNDLVFGKGEYAPDRTEGRRLLAHELTHVVQQNNDVAPHVQRKEKGGARSEKLPPGPGAFTKAEYVEWLRLHPEAMRSDVGPPWTPKAMIERYTTEWLRSRGFFYGLSLHGGYKGARVEIWIMNTGKGREIRVLRERRSERGQTSGELKPETSREELRSTPQEVEGMSPPDLTADPQEQYGEVIATRENVVALGLRGYAVLYKDGTIEVFTEGSTAPFTLRPQKEEGAYLFYDEAGQFIAHFSTDLRETFEAESE